MNNQELSAMIAEEVSKAVAPLCQQFDEIRKGKKVHNEEETRQEQEEKENKFKDMSIKEHIDMLITSGISKKDAIKQAAQERGISKRDVYNEYEKE